MKALLIFSLAALALAGAMGGTAPFGRVLLSVGLPQWATPFFDDPAWQGGALFRARRFDEAAQSFEAAGDPYNLGTAEAFARL